MRLNVLWIEVKSLVSLLHGLRWLFHSLNTDKSIGLWMEALCHFIDARIFDSLHSFWMLQGHQGRDWIVLWHFIILDNWRLLWFWGAALLGLTTAFFWWCAVTFVGIGAAVIILLRKALLWIIVVSLFTVHYLLLELSLSQVVLALLLFSIFLLLLLLSIDLV